MAYAFDRHARYHTPLAYALTIENARTTTTKILHCFAASTNWRIKTISFLLYQHTPFPYNRIQSAYLYFWMRLSRYNGKKRAVFASERGLAFHDLEWRRTERHCEAQQCGKRKKKQQAEDAARCSDQRWAYQPKRTLFSSTIGDSTTTYREGSRGAGDRASATRGNAVCVQEQRH